MKGDAEGLIHTIKLQFNILDGYIIMVAKCVVSQLRMDTAVSALRLFSHTATVDFSERRC